MKQDIEEQIAKYFWHHSIELGKGIVTPGAKSFERCKLEAAACFNRVDLDGRSVLDIGAWNGFFSFDAKKRGAGRVLATDSYCWSDSIKGKETFDLVRSAIGCDVDDMEIDAKEITTDLVGHFDVVLFLGVFYHRYDAAECLAKIAALAKHLLIVETQLDLRHLNGPAMAFFPATELQGDSTNWWAPNEACMKALLQTNGFPEVEISIADPADTHRAIFHAWRSTELRIQPLPESQRLKPYEPPKPLWPKPIRDATHIVLESIRRLRR